MPPRELIDVHGEKGDVDWARVKRAGIDGAYIKATEGRDWKDDRFTSARLKAMREAQLYRGAYHFARPDTDGSLGDARAECRWFIRVVHEAGGHFASPRTWVDGRQRGILAVLDFEKPPFRDSWCRAWGREFKKVTGVEAVLYGYGSSLNPLTAETLDVFGWVIFAAYVRDWKPHADPHVERRVRIWQYTSSGRVPGVQSQPVDRNRWLGAQAPAPGPQRPKRVRRAQADLRKLGWPIKADGVLGPDTKRALADFKRMCVRHRFRRVDGSLGPKTAEVLHDEAVKYRGKVSVHFAYREFASTSRPGGCRGNGWIKGHRELVLGLEALRKQTGRPIGILNGHRDPGKNRCVGGVSSSQHLYGNAVDPVGTVGNVESVRRLGRFSGIGYNAGSGQVRHVDVRHVGPNNTTGGTPKNPTIWRY